MSDDIPYATLRKGQCGAVVPHRPHGYSLKPGPSGETLDIWMSCDGESTVHAGGIVVDPSKPQTGDD